MEKTYTTKDVLFSENQRFRLLWVKILIGIAGIGAISPVLFQLISGHFRDIPFPTLVNSLVPVVLIAAIVFFFTLLELRIRVVPSAILYKFHPIQRKWHQIDADAIISCEQVTYRPLRDYHGWGIRYSAEKGSAYTVSGNKGIRIEKKNGQKIMLGSQQSEALCKAVKQFISR
jgi:hypothetical protein